MAAKKVEVKLVKSGMVIVRHPAVATLVLELREGAPRPLQSLTRAHALDPKVFPVIFFCDRVTSGLRLITPAHWWPLVEAWQDMRLAVCILEEQSAEQARALALTTWQQHVVPLVASKLSAERVMRSEEHTSELQSLMRISYTVLCLKKKQISPSSSDTVKNKK